jgi:STE24 endopeptidase
MNTFAIIILAALVLKFALDLAGNLLNMKALIQDIPGVLQGIYQPEEYRKSQEYIRATTRFGLIDSSFSLFLILVFWFCGGFNWLDQIIRGWGLVSLVSGLLYIGILLLAYSLLKLPFSIYETFVIEQHFGFNRTTQRTFWQDKVKGLGLTLLLGGVLLTGVLTLFQYAGPKAWLYGWVAIIIFSLALQYIAPTWIMPLFNKFTPMEAGQLKEAILGYAHSVNFPLKNVYVMDGSKRSSKSNAFFTGFGRNKRIALFDTLIAQQSITEMVAILAHEVGHYKKKHILQGTLMSILNMGIVLVLLSLFISSPGLYQAFYLKEEPIYAGLLFFSLLYTPLELIISAAMQILSRRHEYAADAFAAETTGKPGDLITALKKLAAANLSNLTPHPFYVWLNYSHPPLMQRIEALKRTKI